ncbi:ATP-binding cassette domain-containing protein [Bacillus ndiopicus]|uniref:ATP-binding cassette domain-containing protein n=1 Tax=Bacillus ndiopicus TaxID=1347368 RepID=UPI0005AA0F61|nr:ATP-binding cassette domain-containing protein [Bacillus ndiopicus]
MIKVRNISKKYKNRYSLKNINLNIEGIYGLIGPNGAGKTTLMRVIAGLIKVDEGEVLFRNSYDSSIKSLRESIAYLPQDFNIYPRVTIEECLNHIAIVKGLSKSFDRKRKVQEVLEIVNLVEHKYKKIKDLSGGMRKRVGIAQMFLTEPKILIIDEPTNGLDISERFRFRNLIRSISKDRTVIITSHIAEDVEFLCNKIGILKNGEILKEGTSEEIANYAKGMVWEITAKPNEISNILHHYTVLNIEKQPFDNLKLRIFSKSQPKYAKPVEPKLIDGYLSILEGDGVFDVT